MKALVFDTETTGLILNRTVRKNVWPEIVEFAGITIDFDTLEDKVSYETLIKPKRPMEAKSIEITGLTNEYLEENGHPFKDVAEYIEYTICSADVVIAHNASFDIEMVDMEFDRLGKRITWPQAICTVEQTVSLQGFRMNLGLLHEYLFGMAHEDAHRAMTDVRALTRIVKELRRREII